MLDCQSTLTMGHFWLTFNLYCLYSIPEVFQSLGSENLSIGDVIKIRLLLYYTPNTVQ